MTNLERNDGSDRCEFSEEERLESDALDRVMATPDATCRRCGVEAEGFRGIVRLSASAGSLDGYKQLMEVPPHVFDSARSLCPSCWSGLLDFLNPNASAGSESCSG